MMGRTRKKKVYGVTNVELGIKSAKIDGRTIFDELHQPPGLKHDQGKLDWSLVPKEFEQVVEVLMFGAKKYAPNNWRKVEDWRRRYYNAARRHLEDWRNGEKLDPESGKPHLAHLGCCVLFLLALDASSSADRTG